MFKTEKLGLWGVIILTTIYLYLINLYFEYIFAKRKYYKGWFLDQPKKNPANNPNKPGPKR